jgi:hypothetical protein
MLISARRGTHDDFLVSEDIVPVQPLSDADRDELRRTTGRGPVLCGVPPESHHGRTRPGATPLDQLRSVPHGSTVAAVADRPPTRPTT